MDELYCKLIITFDVNVQFMSRILKYHEEDLPIFQFASGLHKIIGANRI